MSSPAKKALIKMSKADFLKEHKPLVRVLRHGTREQLNKEANKQNKELKEIK